MACINGHPHGVVCPSCADFIDIDVADTVRVLKVLSMKCICNRMGYYFTDRGGS